MSIDRLPRLYPEAEAAEYLGVTELTLYRWRKRGQIACIMVGKSPRYTDQHITDYLKAREVPVVCASGPKPTTTQRQGANQENYHAPMAQTKKKQQKAKARNEGG